MSTRTRITLRMLAVAGIASIAAPAMAAIDTRLPPEQYQGTVGYVTGGVGEGQARLFKRQMARYPLAIELVEHVGKRAEFTADATVKIANAQGKPVLDAKAAGPFMLVNLPAGRYSVAASLNGATLKRPAVVVAHGKPRREVFEFPARTD